MYPIANQTTQLSWPVFTMMSCLCLVSQPKDFIYFHASITIQLKIVWSEYALDLRLCTKTIIESLEIIYSTFHLCCKGSVWWAHWTQVRTGLQPQQMAHIWSEIFITIQKAVCQFAWTGSQYFCSQLKFKFKSKFWQLLFSTAKSKQ
jgi:hypothetical protein